MATNAAILSAVAQAMKDPSKTRRTPATYLSVLNDAQIQIIEDTECLKRMNTTAFTVVAGTQEYDVPSDFISFPSDMSETKRGFVSIGTNGKYPLIPTKTEYLDLYTPNWRSSDAGVPQYFYMLEGATAKIGLYPKPSTTFVTDNGTAIFMKYIYDPGDIADDSNLPFGNSTRLKFLQHLLKLWAIWLLNLEDQTFEKADRYKVFLDRELERNQDRIMRLLEVPGAIGFDPGTRPDGM